jgi:hypothetical protein
MAGFVRFATFLTTVAVIAVLAAGCGSSSSSQDSSSLSKAEFLVKANAACDRERHGVLSRISSYLEQHGSEGKSEAELIADMAKAVLLPASRAETEALEALGAPPGDEKRIEAMLAAQRKAIAEVAALRRVTSIEAVENRFNQASDQFRAYGLESCAHSAKPVDRRL